MDNKKNFCYIKPKIEFIEFGPNSDIILTSRCVFDCQSDEESILMSGIHNNIK